MLRYFVGVGVVGAGKSVEVSVVAEDSLDLKKWLWPWC